MTIRFLVVFAAVLGASLGWAAVCRVLVLQGERIVRERARLRAEAQAADARYWAERERVKLAALAAIAASSRDHRQPPRIH